MYNEKVVDNLSSFKKMFKFSTFQQKMTLDPFSNVYLNLSRLIKTVIEQLSHFPTM